MTRQLFVYVLFVLATGCSGNNSDTEEENVQSGVFQGQIEAMEKAGDVEKNMQDAAEKRRQAIEQQGG